MCFLRSDLMDACALVVGADARAGRESQDNGHADYLGHAKSDVDLRALRCSPSETERAGLTIRRLSHASRRSVN